MKQAKKFKRKFPNLTAWEILSKTEKKKKWIVRWPKDEEELFWTDVEEDK